MIFSILEVIKLLICHHSMHNLYAIFAKILHTCKKFSDNIVNEHSNILRPGDLEVVSFSITMESIGLNSENYIFFKLREYSNEMSHLISKRKFNDRRKLTTNLCKEIRERIVPEIDGDKELFCIDSKPIKVYHIARAKRCKVGKDDYERAPAFGYCTSQKHYYYGYKLHAICGLSGVTHSFDLTKANVHDIHYLQNVKYEYQNWNLLGDKG